jgi:hypothetical protein
MTSKNIVAGGNAPSVLQMDRFGSR